MRKRAPPPSPVRELTVYSADPFYRSAWPLSPVGLVATVCANLFRACRRARLARRTPCRTYVFSNGGNTWSVRCAACAQAWTGAPAADAQAMCDSQTTCVIGTHKHVHESVGLGRVFRSVVNVAKMNWCRSSKTLKKLCWI